MNSSFVSFLNTYGIIAFILVMFWYVYFILDQEEVALHGLFSGITALFISIILKQLFMIPRPFISDTSILPSAGLAYFSSLPSAHTAVSFAFSTAIVLHKKRLGVFALAISSIIGVGRVLANVHYPIDIAFGILIGVLIGLFFDTIHFHKIRRKKH